MNDRTSSMGRRTLLAGSLAMLSASCGDLEPWEATDAAPAAAPGQEPGAVSAGDTEAAPKAGRTCAGEHNCKPDPRCRLGGDDKFWEVAPETMLKDGAGGEHGTVRGDCYDGVCSGGGACQHNEDCRRVVRINTGQRKDIGGVPHVFTWATPLTGMGLVSGWIPVDAVLDRSVARMGRQALQDPRRGDYVAVWTVTRGDSERYKGYQLPDSEGKGGAADHYLVREGSGLVNLLWSLPGSEPRTCGMVTDSFPVGSTFRRSRGVSEVTVPFYKGPSARSARSLHFIYGHIGDRYGWIAREALQGAAPELQCNLRCCGGGRAVYLGFADDADACIDHAQAVCESRGHLIRARFDNETIYGRHRRCWAKCGNRERYHAVPGVHAHCSEHARDYCRRNDRGGLWNAQWNVCRPG